MSAAPALGCVERLRAPARRALAPIARGRGLEGVRILDFTWAAAGPYATCLLALLGADVVKVESTRRPDPARRGFLADYGGINRSPNFNEINLGKRSFQVDLSQADGLDLAHRLVDWADVVVDNFRPGVMDAVRARRRGAARATPRPARGVVVGERLDRSRRARRRAGEHLRRDRRAVGADRLRRRAADRDRRVDRLPQRQRDGGRHPRRAAASRGDRAAVSTSTLRPARSSSPARPTRSWRTSSVSTGTSASGTRTARCSRTTSTPRPTRTTGSRLLSATTRSGPRCCGVLGREEWVRAYPARDARRAARRCHRRTPSPSGRGGGRRAKRSRHCRPPACRRWRS